MESVKIVCKISLVATLILCSGLIVFGQEHFSGRQDSIGTGKKITFQKLKLYFDDDYLNFAARGTDQYYTAGWQADIYYKRNTHSRSFFDRLLLGLPNSTNVYFYGMFRRIYTPADILHSQVIYGDRPYSSVLTLQHGLTSTNDKTNESLSTEIGLGAIGPITYGSDIQNQIHILIGSQKAMGWGNQIRNNVVLDYKLNYERQILKPSGNLKILANIDCEVGTLVDNAGVGFTLAFGRFKQPDLIENSGALHNSGSHKKILIHCFMHPTIRAVMYNATLEGGLFSKFDPYAIDRADMNTIYLQYDIGFVMQAGKVGISIAEKLRTAEFVTGHIQEVGNVTFYIPF